MLARLVPSAGAKGRRRTGRRRRAALDGALALGADPWRSPELSRRARELLEPEMRSGLAACIANLIDAAEEPAFAWRAHGIDPPLRSHAVLAARSELMALAEALTARDVPSVRGVALASQLVWDAASPIYSAATSAGVARWVDQARRALDSPRS